MAIRDQLVGYDAYQRYLQRKNEAWRREPNTLSFDEVFGKPVESERFPNLPVWKDEFLYQALSHQPYDGVFSLKGKMQIDQGAKLLLIVEKGEEAHLSQVLNTSHLRSIDVWVKEGATLIHDVCLLASQYDYLNVYVEKEGRYEQTFALAHQGRRALRVTLEEKAFLRLQGCAVSSGYLREHVSVEHVGKDSQSIHQLRSVCYGKIDAYSCVNVINQAVGANSSQLLNHLLLTEDASAFSYPSLNIAIDAVSCNHGATMSRVDDQLLFYLLSRGLDYQKAKSLYVDGFIKAAYEGLNRPKMIDFILQANHEQS